MAFTQEERNQWEPMIASYIEEERPPEEIRPKFDIGYTIDDQSIIIHTIRPRWNRPEEKVKIPITKATWVRKQKIWKIYWERADPNWHKYDPLPEVETLQEFIEEVKEDPWACFWG